LVELTKGSYSSGEELAAQLALQINSNESLSKFGHSVSVEYNATDKNFSFTSNKYGSESQVYFTSVDANTANTLGFNTLDPAAVSFLGLQDASLYSPGKDVAGTINGVEASGTGQFLRAVDGNAKATNGFYLGNTATDFSTAVVLD